MPSSWLMPYNTQKRLPGQGVMYGPDQARGNLSALILPYKEKFFPLLGPSSCFDLGIKALIHVPWCDFPGPLSVLDQ